MGAVLAWVRAPGRAVALIVLALAAGIYAADPTLVREFRVSGFDAMQRVWPLTLDEPQVLIVDVDEESLRRYGQWPWPRTLMAELIDRIAAAKPGLLGVDVVFSEPDRLSPPQIPKFIPGLPESVSAALAGMQSSDETLAQAIAKVPTVLAMMPSNEDVGLAAGGPRQAALIVQKGDPPAPFLFTHKSMIRSLPEIAHAARAEASIGTEFDGDGIVRAVPLVSVVGGNLVPALSVELLRLAARARATVVTTGRGGVASVAIGDITMPTDARGRAYPHFQKTRSDRYISAANLLDPTLDPKFDPHLLEKHIVLLGVSGIGLLDQKTTPVGQVLGTEIHAELIELVIAGALLIRHPQALWFELALILVPGLIVIAALRYQRPFIAGAAVIVIAIALVATEIGLFLVLDWLLDTLYSLATAVVVFGTMLGGNYIAARREGRRLEAELERQRQATARLEGELTAARAIQMGLLPLQFPAFPDRAEIDLFARIEPARDVGGDLFDFLLVDHNRLFFMIGDVSGKGIPAALFMATTKEVIRAAASQHGAALDRVLADANAKIGAASNNMAAEGASLMFVTAFAGLLDLTTGEIIYASAGHDSPIVIKEGLELRELLTEGGPPLGTVDDFPYPLSRDRLEAGAVLLLYTDGVTEAQNIGGTLYGARRLTDLLTAAHPDTARSAIDLVFDSLRGFVGAADQFDDITLLAVRRLAG